MSEIINPFKKYLTITQQKEPAPAVKTFDEDVQVQSVVNKPIDTLFDNTSENFIAGLNEDEAKIAQDIFYSYDNDEDGILTEEEIKPLTQLHNDYDNEDEEEDTITAEDLTAFNDVTKQVKYYSEKYNIPIEEFINDDSDLNNLFRSSKPVSNLLEVLPDDNVLTFLNRYPDFDTPEGGHAIDYLYCITGTYGNAYAPLKDAQQQAAAINQFALIQEICPPSFFMRSVAYCNQINPDGDWKYYEDNAAIYVEGVQQSNINALGYITNYETQETVSKDGNTVSTITYTDENGNDVEIQTTYDKNSTKITHQTQKVGDEVTTLEVNSATGAFVVTYPDGTTKTSEQLTLERMTIDEVDIGSDNTFLKMLHSSKTDKEAYNAILAYCCGDTQAADKIFDYLEKNEPNPHRQIETGDLYSIEKDEEIQNILLESGVEIDDNLINSIQSAPTKGQALTALEKYFPTNPDKIYAIYNKLFPADNNNYWHNRNTAELTGVLYSNIGDKFIPNEEILGMFSRKTYGENSSIQTGYCLNFDGEICTYKLTSEKQEDGSKRFERIITNPQGQERVLSYKCNCDNGIFEVYGEDGEVYIENSEQFMQRIFIEETYTSADFSEDTLSTQEVQDRYTMLVEQDSRFGSTMLTYMREVNSQGLFDWVINGLGLTTYTQSDIEAEFESMGNMTDVLLRAENDDPTVAQSAEDELDKRLAKAESYEDVYKTLLSYYGEGNNELVLDIMRSTMCVDENDPNAFGITNVYLDENNNLVVDQKLSGAYPENADVFIGQDASDILVYSRIDVKTIKAAPVDGVQKFQLLETEEIYAFWTRGEYDKEEGGTVEAYETASNEYTKMNQTALEAQTVKEIIVNNGNNPEEAYKYLVEYYQGKEDEAAKAYNDFWSATFDSMSGTEWKFEIALNSSGKPYRTPDGNIMFNYTDCNGYVFDKRTIAELQKTEAYCLQQYDIITSGITLNYVDYKVGILAQDTDFEVDDAIAWFKEQDSDFDIEEYKSKSLGEQYLDYCSAKYSSATTNLFGDNIVAKIVDKYCQDMATYSQTFSRVVSLGCIGASILFPAAAGPLMKMAMVAGYADNAIDLVNMMSNNQQAENDYMAWGKEFAFEYLMKKGYMVLGNWAEGIADDLVGTWAQSGTGFGNYIAQHPWAQIATMGTVTTIAETAICMPYTMLINEIQGVDYDLGTEFAENFIFDFLPYARTLSGKAWGYEDSGFKLTGADGNKYYWNPKTNERIYTDLQGNPTKVVNSNGEVAAEYKYTENGYSVKDPRTGTVKTFEDGKLVSAQSTDGRVTKEYACNEDSVALKSITIDGTKINIETRPDGTRTATVNGRSYELSMGWDPNMLTKCVDEANGDVEAGVKLAQTYSDMTLSVGNVRQDSSSNSCWVAASMNGVANDSNWSQAFTNNITYVSGDTFKISIGNQPYEFKYTEGDNVAEKIYQAYTTKNPGYGMTTEFMDALLPGCDKLVIHGTNPDALGSVKTVIESGSGIVTFNIGNNVEGSRLSPNHAYTVVSVRDDNSLVLKDTNGEEIVISKEEYENLLANGDPQFAGRVIEIPELPKSAINDGTPERIVGSKYSEYIEVGYDAGDIEPYINKGLDSVGLIRYAGDESFIKYCKDNDIDVDDPEAVKQAVYNYETEAILGKYPESNAADQAKYNERKQFIEEIVNNNGDLQLYKNIIDCGYINVEKYISLIGANQFDKFSMDFNKITSSGCPDLTLSQLNKLIRLITPKNGLNATYAKHITNLLNSGNIPSGFGSKIDYIVDGRHEIDISSLQRKDIFALIDESYNKISGSPGKFDNLVGIAPGTASIYDKLTGNDKIKIYEDCKDAPYNIKLFEQYCAKNGISEASIADWSNFKRTIPSKISYYLPTIMDKQCSLTPYSGIKVKNIEKLEYHIGLDYQDPSLGYRANFELGGDGIYGMHVREAYVTGDMRDKWELDGNVWRLEDTINGREVIMTINAQKHLKEYDLDNCSTIAVRVVGIKGAEVKTVASHQEYTDAINYLNSDNTATIDVKNLEKGGYNHYFCIGNKYWVLVTNDYGIMNTLYPVSPDTLPPGVKSDVDKLSEYNFQ